MINTKGVLEKLQNMIGSEFDEDEIRIVFESHKYVIVSRAEGEELNIYKHGICKCYNAYEDSEDSEIFVIYVNNENKIVCVR